jgi:hypothetical protein
MLFRPLTLICTLYLTAIPLIAGDHKHNDVTNGSPAAMTSKGARTDLPQPAVEKLDLQV